MHVLETLAADPTKLDHLPSQNKPPKLPGLQETSKLPHSFTSFRPRSTRFSLWSPASIAKALLQTGKIAGFRPWSLESSPLHLAAEHQ